MILTFDIETVAQSMYLDPAHVLRLDIDNDWLAKQTLPTDDPAFHEYLIDNEIRAGHAVLRGTGVAAALHATTCHIVQASFGKSEAEPATVMGSSVRVRQWDDYRQEEGVERERPLVREICEQLALKARQGMTLVTFNGKQFDLVILRARMYLLGIADPGIPWKKWLCPFDDRDHADLRLLLSGGDRRARGTLQWWADAFGIPAQERGAEVQQMVDEGRWDDLRSYGVSEADTLIRFAARLGL